MSDSIHGSYGNVQVQGIARTFPTVGSAEKSPADFKGTCEAESQGSEVERKHDCYANTDLVEKRDV